MDSLQFFIEQLYDQPSVEEERIAWRAILLGEGAPLWRHCLALAGNPDGRSLLNRLWQRFLDPRAEKQVAACPPHLPAEALLKSARQLVAASIVAHLCLHESTGQNAALASELRQWAQRAVTGQEVPALLADLPTHSPLHNWIECPVERVLQVYDLWDNSARDEGWVAARHASCHIVRRNRPAASRRQSVADRKSGVSALRVPVLLDCRNKTGAVIWLCLQQGEAGRGFAHDLSDSMRCLDTTFLDSLRKVADLVRRRYVSEWDKDVVWWLDDLPANVSLQGESAMGATGVGLLHLLRGLPFDPRYVVSTTVSESDLRLGKVTGFEGPKYPKMAAAQNELSRGQTITILLHRESFTAHGVPAEFPNVRVAHPGDLHEAFEICTALSGGVLRYLRGVVACPDGPGIQLALGGRTLAQLYVFPDFLRSELRPDPENGRGDSADDKPKERAQMDIEEQSLFLERVREVEKRLTWEETRKALDAPGRRAVLLASPGQGKTAWTVMAARELAAQSAEMLVSGARHDRIVVPLAVALKDLLEGVVVDARHNAGDVLRGRLRELVRGSAPDLHAVAVDEVVAGVLSERGWLFLDGLDEVSTSSVATLTKFLEVLKTQSCRVIIASRPYGYKEWRATLQSLLNNPEEYSLAKLNDEQQRKLVANFYSGDAADKRKHIEELLLRNTAAGVMAQNPFLLTLLCPIVSMREVSETVTRTQLYAWGVELMLGGAENAAAWIALLQELAAVLFNRDARTLTIPAPDLLDLFQQSANRPTLQGVNDSCSTREKAEKARDVLMQRRVLVRVGPQSGLVTFSHRTLCEFLMGGCLANLIEPRRDPLQALFADPKPLDTEVIERLNEWSWQREWEKVFLFLAGQLKRPWRLLQLLADETQDDWFRHRLGLAGQCLGEVQSKTWDQDCVLADQITTDVFRLWWQHRVRHTTDAVKHLDSALVGLAQRNARVLMWHGTSEPLPFVDRLARLLEHDNGDVRRSAVDAVRALGGATARDDFLDRLARLLFHYDEDVCRSAAAAVGALGSAAALDDFLDRLARLLEQDDGGARLSAQYALIALGSAAARDDILDRLARLLEHGDEDVLFSAVYAVAMMRSAAARDDILDRLARLLEQDDRIFRRLAADAVGAMGSAAARDDILDRLDRLLEHEDEYFPLAAANAVGAMGGAAARDDILHRIARLLEHDNWQVRSSAANAIEHLMEQSTKRLFRVGRMWNVRDVVPKRG